MTEIPIWLPYANLALNLLIIPLIKVLWDIRMDLTRVSAQLCSQANRLDRLEAQVDNMQRR
jgi:hypothetical protein